MGCPGFNLPAKLFCPALGAAIEHAAETGRQSICSRCYACSGRYTLGVVTRALKGRGIWWTDTPIQERIEELADQIRSGGEPRYFRCYDSGDIDTPEACEFWDRLSRLFPKTLFWLPTKTWVLTDFLPSLQDLNKRPNVLVRPSALCFDDPPPIVPGLCAGHSSAKLEPSKADRECAGKCGRCRACWTRPEVSVNFKDK